MKARILVVSNDAGATEYISHLILEERNIAHWLVYALLNSAASKIFSKHKLNFNYIDQVEDLRTAIDKIKPDIILYGTGWQVDFSEIIKETSMKQNIKSVALIDHWTNYKERFKKNCLPDNIIVMDDIANNIAKKIFNFDVNIIQLKNYFLEEVYLSFKSKQNKSANSIVFISEPISINAKNNFNNKNAFGFTEYSVIEDLIQKFGNICIRLHPAEDQNKYSEIIKRYKTNNISIINSYEEDLIDTLSKSKLTIGMDGMALFISYILGIHTISYMPNSNKQLSIPMSKENLLRNLDDFSKTKIQSNIKDIIGGSCISLEAAIEQILGNN